MYSGNNCRLRWYPRLKIYKNSTGSLHFDPEKEKAWSYNWTFFKKHGEYYLLNDHRYSVTTSRHQSDIYRGFIRDNIPEDKIIRIDTSVCLDRPHALHDAVRYLYVELYNLEFSIVKPGARKKKKRPRLRAMLHLLKKIAKLEKLLNVTVTYEEKQRIRDRIEQNYEDEVFEREKDKADKQWEELAPLVLVSEGYWNNNNYNQGRYYLTKELWNSKYLQLADRQERRNADIIEHLYVIPDGAASELNTWDLIAKANELQAEAEIQSDLQELLAS